MKEFKHLIVVLLKISL